VISLDLSRLFAGGDVAFQLLDSIGQTLAAGERKKPDSVEAK
jgi:hypothetical protein